jgi:hypothetical protein
VGAKWALFAGTQLGAVLHGGPIPWDDDIDLIVDGNKASEFMKQLESLTIGNYRMTCDVEKIFHKTRRCYIDDHAYFFPFGNRRNHWPFIDIFFYYVGQELSLEFSRVENGGPQHRKLDSKVWRNEDFLPFRQAFYGGIMVPTLRLETALLHYDINKCFCGFYNHRIDVKQGEDSHQLNCCTLAKYFPFVRRLRSKFDNQVVLEVMMIGDRPIHLSRVALDSGQVLGSYHLKLRPGDDSRAAIGNKLRGATHLDINANNDILTHEMHSSHLLTKKG